jgi:energy-converting hydrogenase A subunit R
MDVGTIQRLDEIFSEVMMRMDLGRMLLDVTPVGGSEKARAIEDIVHKLHTTFAETMYVGDSITDEEAYRLIRRNGGLTISFNGNRYAVGAAEIAVLSENSIVTAVIAETFIRLGKQAALDLAENWSRESLENSHVDQALVARFLRLYRDTLPKVKVISEENVNTLSKESSEFREKVRGEAIGSLG